MNRARGGAAAQRDALGVWCGWVMVGAAVLTPLLAWLGPLGFAPLLALMGLLCLPAVRLTDEDRPALIVLLGALVWAAVSTTWSPYQPKHPQEGQALKLAAELPLYFAAVCGARRATPGLRRLAVQALLWGLVALGLLFLAETATGAGVYRALHERFYEPIRPDLAQKNIANSTFVAALIAPVVLAGGVRGWRSALLAAPIAAGVLLAAHAFKGDAPILAVFGAALVAALVWRWPTLAPRIMAFAAALAFLAMPVLLWWVQGRPTYPALKASAPASWSQRLGYWSHAIDWIRDRPLRGWGLDSSRAMGPGIQLHPHNGELQVWLELGLIGAIAAAAFWGLTLLRLARPERSLPIAGAAASAAVYLLFATVNFGVWQEWWLALGAFVAVVTALQTAPERGPVTLRSST